MAQAQVSEGEWVDARSSVATLVNTSVAPEVQAYLSPSDLERAVPGQRATLRFADGGRMSAEVIGVEAETARRPVESASPLAATGLSVIVRLRPLQDLPERYRVARMPLEVRFEKGRNWAWLDRVMAQLD